MTSLERIRDVPQFRPLNDGESSMITGGEEPPRSCTFVRQADGTLTAIWSVDIIHAPGAAAPDSAA